MKKNSDGFELHFNVNFLDQQADKAAHPGVTATKLVRYMDKAVHQAAVEKFVALMPAWQGAPSALFAATAPLVKENDYYGPDGEYEFGSMLKKRQASPIPVRQINLPVQKI